MDIRKIALFLAGKLPPFYGESNIYRFNKKLKEFAPSQFTNEEMLFIQQQAKNADEQVYFMVLDDLRRDATETPELGKKSKEDIIELIKSLDVPDEVLGIESKIATTKQYTWSMFEDLLKQRYGNKPSTNDMGDLFEELCFDILSEIGGFSNVKKASAGGDGGVDITATYRLPIGSNTDILLGFFGQSKYKSRGNVQATEVNILTTTISNDITQKYQGVFYFTNVGYSPKAREALDNISHSTSNRKCFWIDGNEILKIVSESEYLRKKYSVG